MPEFSTLPVATTTDPGLESAADKIKLNSIASGATANDTDANLKNRANHTGTQAISTVDGLQDALNAKQATSEKGQVNGYAGLDADGKVPSAQLPDDLGGGATTYAALTDVDTTGLADGDIMVWNATTEMWEPGQMGGGGGGLYSAYICLKDEKTAGTNAGTSTNNTWQKRNLNTEVVDTGNHASIASDQITLEAGTYQCRITVPAYNANRHQGRLRDTTGGTTLVTGTSEFSASGSVSTFSMIIGTFTLAVQSVLEVQHMVQTGETSFGLGVATNNGSSPVSKETYTVAEFWKLT